MSQSKKGSFIESWTNVVVGFGFNFGLNIALLPIMWEEASPVLSAFKLGVVFTFVSVIRSYVLRRVFNKVKAKWNSSEEVSHA